MTSNKIQFHVLRQHVNSIELLFLPLEYLATSNKIERTYDFTFHLFLSSTLISFHGENRFETAKVQRNSKKDFFLLPLPSRPFLFSLSIFFFFLFYSTRNREVSEFGWTTGVSVCGEKVEDVY